MMKEEMAESVVRLDESAVGKTGPVQFALYYGLLAALVNSLITIVNHVAGTSDWSNITIGIAFYFTLIIVCAVMQYYAVKIYRTEHFKENISFAEKFKICFVICLVSYVILSVVNYIFIVYVDADIVNNILATIEKSLVEKQIGPAELDKAMQVAARNVSPSAQFTSVIVNGTVWGTLTGVIISLALKKRIPY
jgi:hypothetical protein